MPKIHPKSDVQSKNIGEGTSIWQYVVILEEARIGSDCNISCHVFIENDVKLGDRVTVKSGVQLWDGLRVKDDVFIGPNVTFANDKYPRSKQYPDQYQNTFINEHSSIGAAATILGGSVIGAFAMVGAGAVVTKDVPERALVVGNPAKIVGWVNTDGSQMEKRNGCWVDTDGQEWVERNKKIIRK
jgi:acetyltransferase-like isoleucine patch superfamily enzyme